MTSTNPYVPLTLVSILGQVTEERASLPSGPKHVSAFVHEGRNVRPRRFVINNDSDWDGMIGALSNLINQGPAETVTIFYPTVGDPALDYGIHLSKNAEPLYLAWTNSPKFDLRLAPDGAAEDLQKGVGVDVAKALLKN